MKHFIKYKKPLLCLGSYMLLSFSLFGQTSQKSDSIPTKGIDLAAKVHKEVNLGFNTEKNRNIAGAISSIVPDEFLKYDNTQWVRDALNGRINGLKYSDNIRGLGNAMIVVDGIPGRSIDLLNMEEIQEITVLKDANAVAMYGSMGKNGVIVVTTKRGSEKTEFNISASTGVKNAVSMPNYLGSAEYMQLYNEARANDGLSQRYSDADIANFSSGNNPYRYPNVDLYSSDYFGSLASFTNVIGDFSGSKDETKYYINFGFKSDENLQNFTDNDKGTSRFNVRGNIDFRVNSWIKSSIDAIAIIEINKSSLTNLYDAGKTLRPNLYAPLLPIDLIDTTGNPDLAGTLEAANKFGGFILGGNQFFNDNPIASGLGGGKQTSMTRISQFNNAIDFDLNSLIKGLSAKTFLSFDFYNRYNATVNNAFAIYQPTWNADNKIIDLVNVGDNDLKELAETIETNIFTIRYGFFGLLNYEKEFNKNNYLKASLVGFTNNTITKSVTQSDKNSNISLGLNYRYKNRFLFDLNTSYVHSVKLAEGNRGQIAPTFGFGYILSEEPSLKNATWLNYLKIRSSAGIVYSDLGVSGHFLYDAIYQQGSGNYKWGDRYGTGFQNGYTKVARGENTDLGMEKRTDYNLGFEGLFFNKLWVEANVFRSILDDQVIRASTIFPQYYNEFRPYSNFNADSRSGFEVGVKYSDKIGGLGLDIGARVLHTDSRRTKVDEVYEDDYQYRKGTSIDAYWGLKSLGFFAVDDFNTDGSLKDGIPTPEFGAVQPGDLRYSDINKDGVVNDQDQVVIGRWDSPWTFGSDIKLSYKSFTLFTLLTAQTGGDAIKSDVYYQPQGDNKYSEVVLGRWTETTANTATFPRLTSLENTNNFGKTSDFWLYDNSNFKIERVQLTYDLPKKLVSNLNMHDFSVYASGANLLMIANNKSIKQLSLSSVPQYRYYTLGLRAKF